ncbi:MAG: hypothetical protein AAF517_16050, partial [Planctomycetota bacterium]
MSDTIVLLPLGRESAISDLAFATAPIAHHSARGLFLHGRLEPSLDDRPVFGVRYFQALEDGVWRDVDDDRSSRTIRSSHDTASDEVRVVDRGQPLTLPPLDAWRSASELLEFHVESNSDMIRFAPPLSLRAARPGIRAGLLCPFGKGAAIASSLVASQDAELRDIRRGDLEEHWWITTRNGLAENVPTVGRELRNLGTPVEPILLPNDREPNPLVSPRAIREIFEVGEGCGLLWWDDGAGERYSTFRRSQLRPLSREELGRSR